MISHYPLNKANRIRLARAFRRVPRVDLSIDCVIEGQMGAALVDDLEHPQAFKIEVGPFFYFAGDVAVRGGHGMLEKIAPYTLFMPSEPGWIEGAKTLHGEKLIRQERYSFSAEPLSTERLNKLSQGSPFRDRIKRMDFALASPLWGQNHFVDLSDDDSPKDFVQRSIGYHLADGESVLGAAYASLVCNKGIEVSIFVLPEHRCQGIATGLACHLLLWCLDNDMEAHWDAANPESCRLAEKLGYVAAGTYHAHFLRG